MTKTLLAVEDSKTMRKVLGITFANDEFEAVVAESPQQALSQLDQLRPDMVLVDVTLGEVNGYDLCRQVKSARTLPCRSSAPRALSSWPARSCNTRASSGAIDFSIASRRASTRNR